MTPTEAYKSAEGRDAGHDEFQAKVWRDLKDGARSTIDVRESGTSREYSYEGSWVEFPLVVRSNARRYIAGFADILVLYSRPDPWEHLPDRTKKYRVILEIKPRIWSVGSIIRQCKALEYIAGQVQDWEGASVRPVVPKSDPKLPLLTELSRGRELAWDWAP